MTELTITELENLLKYHNRLYYDLDKPEITDVEYDTLYKKLKELDPENSVLQKMGNPTFGDKYEHNTPMLSLDKCHTAEEIYNKFKGKKVIAMPKIDGISISIIYKNGSLYKAVTRGNGKVGEDVTLNALEMTNIVKTIDVSNEYFEIRGEAYIKRSDFYGIMNKPGYEGHENGLKNPRNAASGGIRQKDPRTTRNRKVSFICHSLPTVTITDSLKSDNLYDALYYIGALGIPVVPVTKVNIINVETVNELIESFRAYNETAAFETDGIVIRLNDETEYNSMGMSGSRYPKGAVAFKFDTEKESSVIKSIEWSVGRTGRVNPVANIEPVELCGTTVSRVTLNNIDWMKEKGYPTVGDTVIVEKANEIIPQIVSIAQKVESDDRGKVPTNCPSCGIELVKSTKSGDEKGSYLLCPNSFTCEPQIVESIQHIFNKLEIKNISTKTIEKLLDKKIIDLQKPWTVFDITEEQLIKNGFGARQSQIYVNAVKNVTTTPQKLLGSLGIHMWGESMFEILFDHDYDVEKALNGEFDEDALLDMMGVGMTKVNVLINNMKRDQVKEFLTELKKRVNVSLPSPKTTESSNVLDGKSFCLTGTMSRSRKTLEEQIKGFGGTIKSVSSKLDYLVCGDKPGSKLTKANNLGVKVLTEKELEEMINEEK